MRSGRYCMRILAALLALALVVPAAHAQRVYRVGMLNFGSASPSVLASPINNRFVERLAELGFREGRNLVLERRYADASFERIAPLTAELAQAKVDVILTVG